MQNFFTKTMDEETCCIMAYSGDDKRVVIPANLAGKKVTILYDALFKGHDEITHVKIPSTVTNIGSYFFEGCTKLKEVKLPDGLTEIWDYAFSKSSIEEITLPDGVKVIMPFTFKDCKKLKKVVCGKGLEKICAGAFEGCDKLKEVVYGPGVDVSPEAYGTEGPAFTKQVHEDAVKAPGYADVGKR